MKTQTKTAHTAGPWHVNAASVNGKRDHAIYSDSDNRTYIASVVHRDNLPADEIDANAKLIAAAPDLLEALELAAISLAWARDIGDMPQESLYMETLRGAQAAIAKATGQA